MFKKNIMKDTMNHEPNHKPNHEQNHEQNHDSWTMSQTINLKLGLDPINHLMWWDPQFRIKQIKSVDFVLNLLVTWLILVRFENPFRLKLLAAPWFDFSNQKQGLIRPLSCDHSEGQGPTELVWAWLRLRMRLSQSNIAGLSKVVLVVKALQSKIFLGTLCSSSMWPICQAIEICPYRQI